MSLVAQPGTSAGKPSFQSIRYEEDYRYLADSLPRTHPLEAVKYVPLGERKDYFLSLGGQSRQLWEYFRHENWLPVGSDGYYLHRYYLHGDLHLGPHTRIFGEVGSGWAWGRREGPRPIDEDRLFVHQAFVELRAFRSKDTIQLRVGRQEVLLGAGRMITFREFPNLRLSFDGLSIKVSKGKWNVATFAFRPVTNRRGVLDNSFLDSREGIWGVYSGWPFPLPANLDLYYLGYHRRRGRFNQGEGQELRHSVGARLWRKGPHWDYDLETLYQGGHFAGSLLSAWLFSLDVGCTLAGTKRRPRLGLKADWVSGDRNPAAEALQTFRSFFANPAYFSQAALFTFANVQDVHPSLTINLLPSLEVKGSLDFIWRTSAGDGLYGPDGSLRRAAGGSPVRYVGRQVQGEVTWKIHRFLTASCVYVHFFAGPYLQTTQPIGTDVDFMNAWLAFQF